MSQARIIEVSEDHTGQRLDNFLQREMNGGTTHPDIPGTAQGGSSRQQRSCEGGLPRLYG